MAQGPQRRSDVLFRHVGDQIVALNPRTQQVHALEPLAARVFQTCDGSLDVKALADRLDIPATNVSDIVDSLASVGIILGNERKLSRRKALAGGAGLGAGLMASIVLPTPAMAASGGPRHTPELGSGQGNEVLGNGAIAEPQSNPEPPDNASPGAGSEPSSSVVTPDSARSNGLAFTGIDVTETVAVAAGAIGTGAAMVAAVRKRSET